MSPPVGIGKKCPKIVAYKVRKIYPWFSRIVMRLCKGRKQVCRELRSTLVQTASFVSGKRHYYLVYTHLVIVEFQAI